MRAGSLANIAGQRANWIGQILPHKVASTDVHAPLFAKPVGADAESIRRRKTDSPPIGKNPAQAMVRKGAEWVSDISAKGQLGISANTIWASAKCHEVTEI